MNPLLRTAEGYLEAAGELQYIASQYGKGGEGRHVQAVYGLTVASNEARLRYHANLLAREFKLKAKRCK